MAQKKVNGALRDTNKEATGVVQGELVGLGS